MLFPASKTNMGLIHNRLKSYTDLETFPTKSGNEHPDFESVLSRLEVELAALRHKQAMLRIWHGLITQKEEKGGAFSDGESKFNANMERWYNMFEPSDIGNFKSDVGLAMCFEDTEKIKAACASMERLNHVEKCMNNAKRARIMAPIPIKKTIEKKPLERPILSASFTTAPPSRCNTPPPSTKKARSSPNTSFATPQDRARHIFLNSEI